MAYTVILLSLVLLTACLRKLATSYSRSKKAKEMSIMYGCQDPQNKISSRDLVLMTIMSLFNMSRRRFLAEDFAELFEGLGTTFEMNLLGYRGIETVDPAIIEFVLSTAFKDFDMGVRKNAFSPLLGNGIFAADGKIWKAARDLYRPLFNKSAEQMRFDIIQDHTERLIQTVLAQSDRETVNLQPLFFRFTLDSTSELIFGKNHRMSEATVQSHDETTATFEEAFRDAQEFLVRRYEMLMGYCLVNGRKFRKDVRTVKDWAQRRIGERVAGVAEDQQRAESPHTLMDAMSGLSLDKATTQDQVINLLLAGRDTTACTLSWTFRLLVRHPHVLRKLRKEIETTIGWTSGELGPRPSRLSLENMKYLRIVIREVLRLYPPVPINGRAAVIDTVLPTGGGPQYDAPIFIRKGTAIEWSVYSMHRRTDLYGPDAREFRPERWTVPAGEPWCLDNIGWAYLPFNGGPRVCLGQEFALLEIKYAVVRLLQIPLPFSIGTGDAPEELEIGDEEQSLTLVLGPWYGCEVDFPLHLRADRRSDEATCDHTECGAFCGL